MYSCIHVCIYVYVYMCTYLGLPKVEWEKYNRLPKVGSDKKITRRGDVLRQYIIRYAIAASVTSLVDVSHSLSLHSAISFISFSFPYHTLFSQLQSCYHSVTSTRLFRYSERHLAKVPQRRLVPRFFGRGPPRQFSRQFNLHSQFFLNRKLHRTSLRPSITMLV